MFLHAATTASEADREAAKKQYAKHCVIHESASHTISSRTLSHLFAAARLSRTACRWTLYDKRQVPAIRTKVTIGDSKAKAAGLPDKPMPG
jgi:hypothetical protein